MRRIFPLALADFESTGSARDIVRERWFLIEGNTAEFKLLPQRVGLYGLTESTCHEALIVAILELLVVIQQDETGSGVKGLGMLDPSTDV
ncbi:MAG: hypothetical protein M2R45_02226 [Verrucomicrobia subdivision 3 bacterium]|nr:hypothetical protein [Limisphaerales bacterium]MCS1413989.1 hypothetical protein [Limisphaerales bacterium]